MSRVFHLAVVNSHPIQYFAPLYAYLCRDPSLKVTALYCSDFSLRGAVDPGFKQAVTWDVDLLPHFAQPILPLLKFFSDLALKVIDQFHLGMMINVYARRVGLN